ncbi:hypothetical protein OKW45_003404 [Paraburkholderia sp. WSM4175]|uniref:DUF3987 domain-containing protein n=1 Tax=Paraburkholderia sp. WSM4175 TaxID=2991072 RepID=UPI003D1A2CAB
MDGIHPALESHFAKYRKQVPALALTCHLADGGRGPVSVTAMVRALAWADYLKSHALRAYGTGMTAPMDRARALLEKIRAGKLPSLPFALKKIYDACWSMLTNREEAAEAVSILIEHGYMAEVAERNNASKGGRPREPRYVINPEVTK